MCRQVFVGSESEIALCASAALRVEAFPERAAPLRPHLGLTHAYYLGAHGGCSCDFLSTNVRLDTGADTYAAALTFAPALTDEERAALERDQGSRVALARVLGEALARGRVRLVSSWWGEEEQAPRDGGVLFLDDLATRLEPFEDHALYELAP